MTRKEAEGMLYRREGSRYWYFSYFDKDAGRRIRQSTKTDDRNEAVVFVMAYVEKRLDDIRCRNLKELIMLFADAKTNPRFIEAQADGGHYGYGHAVHIAGTAKALVRLLEHKAPRYLRLPLRSIDSETVRKIKILISESYGRTCKAQKAFQAFKSFINYGVSRGWMAVNPTQGVRNISYNAKTRPAVDIVIIRQVLELYDMKILPDEYVSFFVIGMTTGMRRSEILALSPSQFKDGYLMIDRNLKAKSEGRNCEIGKPKWDEERKIPLPEVTVKALEKLTPRNGRYFNHGYSWAAETVARVVAAMMALHPENAEEWRKVTCHVLRHSLLTTLKLLGVPEFLLDSWFGWGMGNKTMEDNYFHVYAEHLHDVANTVDYIFSDEFRGLYARRDPSPTRNGLYYDLRPEKGYYDGTRLAGPHS